MSTSNRRPWLILGICCLSLLIVGTDVTIVNVALPAIRQGLHASLSGLQWSVDAYTLVIGSLLMASGSMADRFGRRRVFQVGLVLFTLGSLLCSLAPSVTALVAFRCVQALGGSMLNPVALSIVSNTFTERRARARAMGVWAAVFGISLALGPVVGGLLVTAVSWRAIFWINVPIGIAAIILTQLFVPESRAAAARRFDPWGQLLVVVILVTLTYGVIEGPSDGWGSPLIVAMFAASAAAAVSLVLVELRREQPLLQVRFFRSVPFSGASLIAVLAFGELAGFLFLNTLYLQEGRGYSALHAGLLTLPMAAMIFALRAGLGPAGGHQGPAPAACPGRASHGGRLRPADPADRHHAARLPAGLLCGARPWVRPGERPDRQHGGIWHAGQPGRGGRLHRVGQPTDGERARGRGHRLDRGRGARERARVGQPRRVGGARRLRARGRRPRVRVDHPARARHGPAGS